MGNKAKVAVLILIILFIASLALAGGAFYLFQQEHGKNMTLQAQLNDLKERQRITENDLQGSKKNVSDLSAKLKDVQAQLDSVGDELKQTKTDKEAALNKISQLNSDLEQQRNLRADLESKLTTAQEDTKKTQAQLRVLEAQRVQLEGKISQLETQAQGVELGKIVVNPDAKKAGKEKAKAGKKALKEKGPEPKPVIEETKPAPVSVNIFEGKVLVINKEYNFAVLSLGSHDGINVGDLFSVYHDNSYIGDLRVEKLHDSMSAANFATPDIKDKIAEGDKVVQKGK